VPALKAVLAVILQDGKRAFHTFTNSVVTRSCCHASAPPTLSPGGAAAGLIFPADRVWVGAVGSSAPPETPDTKHWAMLEGVESSVANMKNTPSISRGTSKGGRELDGDRDRGAADQRFSIAEWRLSI
jgi:hypothetical protein